MFFDSLSKLAVITETRSVGLIFHTVVKFPSIYIPFSVIVKVMLDKSYRPLIFTAPGGPLSQGEYMYSSSKRNSYRNGDEHLTQ